MTHITAAWNDAERTQILLTYQAGWNWDEWLELDCTLVEWLSRARQNVDIIHDIRLAELPKDTLSRLPLISTRTVAPCHPNAGNLAIVGFGASQDILSDILSRLYDHSGRHIQTTRSVTEASSFLIMHRQLLDTGHLV